MRTLFSRKNLDETPREKDEDKLPEERFARTGPDASRRPQPNFPSRLESQTAHALERDHRIRGVARVATSTSRGGGDIQQILKSAREILRIIERELAEPTDSSTEEPRIIQMTEHACDILYVEDDLVNFTLVERILEFRPGLNLMHAMRGELGIQFAEACQPRLILLDLNLPDMHGSEVLRDLQQNPETAEIPVVILSADATPSQIERLLAAGARNYLTKPFDLDPFLALIDEFAMETPERIAPIALV